MTQTHRTDGATRGGPPAPRAAIGLLGGLSAALIWAAYLSYSRAGALSGLAPGDIVFLRYSVAGLVMLPWLLWHGWRDLAGVGWGRGAALAVGAGPLFVGLTALGYNFAPLSHGAVLQPSTVALVSLILGWAIFGEAMRLNRVVGTLAILSGIVLIASRSGFVAEPGAWRGDIIFVCSAMLWVSYTVLLKRWSVGALQATAAVSVISALVILPIFLLGEGASRLAALPRSELLIQFAVQGLGAGVLALVGFGKAVEHLGAARAALFPAMVPAATLIVGIPITGEVPSALEWTGAGLATAGLAIAMSSFRLRLRPSDGHRA
jgi:drug/metabolite transporter (DMT)-like permease